MLKLILDGVETEVPDYATVQQTCFVWQRDIMGGGGMRALIALSAIMLLCVPAIAEAQGVGSHIRRDTDAPRDLDSNDPGVAERAANAFARCTADRRGPLARTLLAMPYRSEEQSDRAGRLLRGTEECMNDIGFQLRADTPTLLGGMAEHYLRVFYDDADLAAVSGLTEESIAELGLTPRNAPEFIGLCAARANPAAIRAFVSTEPASDDEAEALGAVVPLLGPCVPEGETVRLDRRSVRSIAAVGLYRALAAAEAAE